MYSFKGTQVLSVSPVTLVVNAEQNVTRGLNGIPPGAQVYWCPSVCVGVPWPHGTEHLPASRRHQSVRCDVGSEAPEPQ